MPGPPGLHTPLHRTHRQQPLLLNSEWRWYPCLTKLNHRDLLRLPEVLKGEKGLGNLQRSLKQAFRCHQTLIRTQQMLPPLTEWNGSLETRVLDSSSPYLVVVMNAWDPFLVFLNHEMHRLSWTSVNSSKSESAPFHMELDHLCFAFLNAFLDVGCLENNIILIEDGWNR